MAPNSIQILPDLTRRIPVVDPDNHHIFASLGCAAENLAIAAGARGKAGDFGLPVAGLSLAILLAVEVFRDFRDRRATATSPGLAET